MISIGPYLKEARLKKKYSVAHVEGMTKIKRDFIEAIEDQNWNSLPSFSVVSGFVKSIAKSLEISEHQAAAFLRRDYPPKDIRINPKPDVSDHFSWTPKLTFFVGIFLILSLILGYLGYEYINFISPPRLEITSPKEEQEITRTLYKVEGKVSPGSTVKVNNQEAQVDDNGNYESQIEVSKELKEITVVATSRSGKVTTVHRTIKPELK